MDENGRIELQIDSRLKFFSLLEAIQQYIDSGKEMLYTFGEDDTIREKLGAVEEIRDQLEVMLEKII